MLETANGRGALAMLIALSVKRRQAKREAMAALRDVRDADQAHDAAASARGWERYEQAHTEKHRTERDMDAYFGRGREIGA